MWLKWKFAWSHDVNELKWLHHPIYCTATHWLRFLLSFPARLQHSSPLCGSWRLEPTVKPQTWRRDSSPSSMPSLPHCLPPDGPPLKFSVRAATVKAERRLNTAGVSGCGSGKKKKDKETERLERRLLRDGGSKGEALTGGKKRGIECVDVGWRWTLPRCVEASVSSAERQDGDEKRQC